MYLTHGRTDSCNYRVVSLLKTINKTLIRQLNCNQVIIKRFYYNKEKPLIDFIVYCLYIYTIDTRMCVDNVEFGTSSLRRVGDGLDSRPKLSHSYCPYVICTMLIVWVFDKVNNQRVGT